MKRKLLFTLLFLSACTLLAQDVPNHYFDNPSLVPCPWDATGQTTVVGFPEWNGYQTLDDTWSGTIDSTQCVDIAEIGTDDAIIHSVNFQAQKPLFIASVMDSTSYVHLDSNNLYGIRVLKYPSVYLNEDDTCANGICSGIITEVEIPNSTGSGSVIRQSIVPFSNEEYDFCIVTEKFPDHNLLKTFVIKYLASDPLADESITTYSVWVEDMSFQTLKLTRIDAYDFDGNDYSWENWNWDRPNSLLIHHDSTYPSAQNISYIDVFPSPNTPDQQNVNVIINFMQSINFQPFTALRGGQVDGDTIRHNYNLINNGGTICMSGIVELILNKNDHFTHQQGNISFGDKSACMMFKGGSSMIIDKGATLNYGRRGVGMLALRSGSTIDFRENAELIIHNTLVLKEDNTEEFQGEVTIDLKSNTLMKFAPGSTIKIQSDTPEDFKLNVLMNGGTLDDSGLSSSDKLKIRRIWPSELSQMEDKFQVLSNPIQEKLAYKYESDVEETLRLKITDINGSVLLNTYRETKIGENAGNLDLSSLGSGLYFLTIGTNAGKWTTKILKSK